MLVLSESGRGATDSPPSRIVASRHQVIGANDVHMLWQIPQYFLLTLGEILISVTGLEFSYSQSPLFMKSVLQVTNCEFSAELGRPSGC